MSLAILKIINAVSYVVYLIAVVLVVIYIVFWVPFVNELKDRGNPDVDRHTPGKYINRSVLNQVGSVRRDKKSSFVNFTKQKAPSVQRVCSFGDSFTYGADVDADDDFPTILQGLFERRGYTNIEVLNFGNSWHGFHQAYLMWDLIGSHFDCGYVLLGPKTFFPDRDMRFNHTNLLKPYYLHARFVLENGGLRLINVAGTTPEERFSDYFSLFPRWEYLRYDRNPPPILQSMLPEGRTINNPFYYVRGSERKEALKTYELLLRQLAERAPQVVLAHYDREIVELGKSLELENMVVVENHREMGFPYRSTDGHNSAMGNRVVAEQFFAHLIASSANHVDVLESFADELLMAVTKNPSAPKLSSYERIGVRIGDELVGRFSSPQQTEGYEHFQKDEVDTLVAILGPDIPLVDASFFSVGRPLTGDTQLVLHVVRGGKKKTFVLGEIQWLHPQIRIGSVQVHGIRYKRLGTRNIIYFTGNKAVPFDVLSEGDVRFELSIGNEQLLWGKRRDMEIKFDKGNANSYVLRSAEGQGVDIDKLASIGNYDLVLFHKQYGELSVPIGSWKKHSAPIPTPNHLVTKPVVKP